VKLEFLRADSKPREIQLSRPDAIFCEMSSTVPGLPAKCHVERHLENEAGEKSVKSQAPSPKGHSSSADGLTPPRDDNIANCHSDEAVRPRKNLLNPRVTGKPNSGDSSLSLRATRLRSSSYDGLRTPE